MLLKAVAVGVGVLGLVMIAIGMLGREPGAVPGRMSKVRAAGAATASRRRGVKIVASVAAGAGVWLLSGWPVAGATTVVLLLTVPYFFGAGKVVKQRIDRLEALDEWVRRLADTMAAGQAPIPAIVQSAERAPAPIHQEVTRLATKLATPRLDRQIALQDFARDLDDTVGDLVALSLGIAVGTRTSDKVPEVLRTLAEGVSEEVRARRDIEAKRSGPRSESRLIVIVQVIIVVALSLATEYMTEYSMLLGQLVMAVLALLMIASLAMLRRFSVGAQPPRILAEGRRS